MSKNASAANTLTYRQAKTVTPLLDFGSVVLQHGVVDPFDLRIMSVNHVIANEHKALRVGNWWEMHLNVTAFTFPKPTPELIRVSSVMASDTILTLESQASFGLWNIMSKTIRVFANPNRKYTTKNGLTVTPLYLM